MKRAAKIILTLLGAGISLGAIFLDLILTGSFEEFGYFQAIALSVGLLILITAYWEHTKPLVTPILKNLPIILVSLAITLVLIEIVLRQFYFPTASPAAYRKPDPILGWRLEPSVRLINQNVEFSVPIEYNSRGWRDTEHTLEKPEGTFRILVLGDSFMEAYSVALDDAFHRQLESLINASRATQIEVINLGVGGYGTLQEYQVFMEEGRLYDPDLVLVAFYTTNDVRNNSMEIEAESTETFKVNSRPYLLPGGPDDWEVVTTHYELAVQEYEEAIRQAQEEDTGFSIENLAIVRLIRQAQLRRDSQALTSADANLEQNLHFWIGVDSCEPTVIYDEAWTITSRIFARLHQAVEDSGGQLVVFTVPGLQEVDQEFKARVEELDPDHIYCLDSLPGNDRLRDVLSDLDVPMLDLVPTFREEENNKGVDLFRWTDQHWNEAGHALAAEQVYEFLSDQGLLPE